MSPNIPQITPELSHAPTLLALASLAPREEPPLNLYLAAVDTLVQWQLSPMPQAAAQADAATLLAQLQSFCQGYLVTYRQCTLDEGMRKTVDAALATLVAQTLALPTCAVHGGFAPDQLVLDSHPNASFAVGAPSALAVGPVGYDIASLTRDPRLLWDEAFTLDVAIRYWDKARKAGLPVGADFGEFYRGLEWTALLRHLTVLGARAHAAAGAAPEDGPALMALILTTCNRYIELKPLLRLLERIEGLDVQGGFVFGRM
jgi:hypothetical protein